MNDENKDDNAKHDILEETKKLAIVMIRNPEFAEKAIHDRNINIKSLRSIIEHRKAVYQENYDVYHQINKQYHYVKKENELLADKSKTLQELLTKTEQLLEEKTSEYNDSFTNLKIEREINEKGWRNRLEKYAESISGWKGAFLRLIVSKPFLQYLVIIIFCLMFVASLVGWPKVASLLGPLFKMFS